LLLFYKFEAISFWLPKSAQKYKKLYPFEHMKKMKQTIKAALIDGFFKKCALKANWHDTCIIKSKSDTLISFLLKKVCFVPQSGPFSIMAFGRRPVYNQENI